ncbi:MAG: beta-galactosidase [Lentisphaeria bacterium]|nr:beta-galactosidase [Lentisphaeria bacterium]
MRLPQRWNPIAFLLALGPAVVAGTAEAPAAAATPPPRFEAWYRFETPQSVGRSTGFTVWPAAARDIDWLDAPQGRFGGAIQLPGSTGNGLYLPNPKAFFGETCAAGTVALWVCRGSSPAGTTEVLFDAMVSTGNTRVDGHEVVLMTRDGALVAWPALSRRLSVPDPLVPGTWVHLALTWDCGAGAVLYVDGVPRASAEGAFEPVALSEHWPARVGCHTAFGAFPFRGLLDEVRIANRAFGAEEVQGLHALDPSPPAVTAVLENDDVLVITNADTRAVALGLDRWLADAAGGPPWYGFTPAHFSAEVWTAPVTPTEAFGEAWLLEPGASRRESAVFPADHWGPGRIRLLAGEGLARQELAVSRVARTWLRRRVLPAAFGVLDREGLRISVEGPRPPVFAVGRPLEVPLRLHNGLDRTVRTTLQAELRGRPDRVQARTTLPVTLAPGEQQSALLRFEPRMGRGRFAITVTTPREEGRIPLLKCDIFGVDPEPAAQTCAVGAACVGDPLDETLLQRMAADGVTLLRLGGKTDGASFRRNQAAALAYGMRVWRTPAFSYSSVCADPARRAALRAQAADLGRGLRGNLGVLNQSMAGEGLSAPPCYCPSCTAAFRDCLRRRHGDLGALNRAWGSTYGAWEEIVQLGSPEDVDMAAERLKMTQTALELPAENTARWRRLFELDPPRAMAWRRWHDDLLLTWYRDFADAFHGENQHTVPIGEQPCWPNFKTHVFFPLAHLADSGGMDLYLPGEMKTTLGYAAELFLNFDLNASVYRALGKPVMVHELYVQDLSPEGLAEAQGWWLAGRGYNVMTYFTYDYYHEGTRAGLPLVFGLFDKEGNPYPCYASFKQFSIDFFRFAARHDPARLRPLRPGVTLFLGDDMSLANVLETGGATWNADGVHGHNGTYWLTERAGIPVAFLNDEGFHRLGKDDLLLVPWCPVVRPESVRQILGFAKNGGTVILDGPFARFDDNCRPYPECPGAGAAAAIGVSCTAFETGAGEVILPDGQGAKSRGRALGLYLADKVTVLCRDRRGDPAIVRAPVGAGSVVWCLSALGPEHRSRNPAAAVLDFWRELLSQAGQRPRAVFAIGAAGSDTDPGPGGLDHGGRGLPDTSALADVAIRIHEDRDAFVFLTSFFAPSAGEVSIDLPSDRFSVRDAVSGQPFPVRWEGNLLRFPLALKAFAARVIHIAPIDEDSRPFAEW